MSDKSRQTIYGRSTPEERKRIREETLMVPCGYCCAKAGERCIGSIGRPAQPHWERQRSARKRLASITPTSDALQIQEGGSHYKETGIDTKGEVGKSKPQLHLIPRVSLEAQAGALELGRHKYGESNWRYNTVCQSTYISAIMRHTAALQDGEDLDPESGISHLGHIMAGCAIILDAAKCGTLVDDRVKPVHRPVDSTGVS